MSLPVVLIIQHDPHDKPCYFGTYLETHAIPYVVWPCFESAVIATALPSTVTDSIAAVPLKTSEDGVVLTYRRAEPTDDEAKCRSLRIAGVASLGGYMSVNDHLPYFSNVLSLYRSAISLRIPVIGHCLGGQLLSVALGGTVSKSPAVELGWVTVQAFPDPHDSTHENELFDWFGERQSALLFEWHGESFSIPEGCARIAGSDQCPNQAFQVIGKPVLGMQFHVEVERSKMDSWVAEGHPSLFPTVADKQAAMQDPQRAADVCPSAMTVAEMFDTNLFDERLANSKIVADHIYQTWCSFLPLQ